nr:hypothetical protein [Candidatus Gracilibacteria bacterium]
MNNNVGGLFGVPNISLLAQNNTQIPEAQCGLSNGSIFDVTPTDNLCSLGNPSSVTYDGSKYNWNCDGGGVIAFCSAYKNTCPNENKSGLIGGVYYISTSDDLVKLSNGTYPANGTYVQTKSIDMNGISFNPILNFAGTYDGEHCSISNLVLNKSGVSRVGFFGSTVAGVTLKNIYLKNLNVTGLSAVGGLLGYAYTGNNILNNIIENVTVSGGGSYIGGLVGEMDGTVNTSIVKNSYLKGGTVSGVATVGGLVGRERYGGEVSYNLVMIDSIIRTSGTNTQFGRVMGQLSSGGPLNYNYANTNMTSSVAVVPGITIKDGASTDGSTDMQRCLGVNTYIAIPTWSGDGTQGNPYLVSSLEHLCYITRFNKSAYYKQTQDISLSGISNFMPIGMSATDAFAGKYNGDNKQILGLNMNYPVDDNIGLFGYISNNVILENIKINNANIVGNNDTAALVGLGGDSNTIQNLSFTNIYSTGASNVGGGVGKIGLSSLIKGVHIQTGDIKGVYDNIGGLVGYTNTGNNVSNNIIESVNVTGRADIGGLIGETDGSPVTAIIKNNYIKGGDISGISVVGGLVGRERYGGDTSYNLVMVDSVVRLSGTNTQIGRITGQVSFGGTLNYNYANANMTSSVAVVPGITIKDGASTDGSTDMQRCLGVNTYIAIPTWSGDG